MKLVTDIANELNVTNYSVLKAIVALKLNPLIGSGGKILVKEKNFEKIKEYFKSKEEKWTK